MELELKEMRNITADCVIGRPEMRKYFTKFLFINH